MKPQRKRRLTTVFLILISSAFGSFLIIKALDSNLDFFFTPTELYAQNIPDNKRIKVPEVLEKYMGGQKEISI